MATYFDIWTAAQDAQYQARVDVAALNASVAISGEAQGGQSQEAWDRRRAYARNVLEAGGAPEMAVTILAQLDQADHWAASDQQIFNTVAGLWNAYAGAV